ncbi:MAG: histidinol-phosphatase, partial [Planctomycetota bacterium]|nr:histidinol-phosphatase [Planctomycetota bacterium]
AVQEAAAGSLAVIAGIEIATSEEIHVIGLFPGTGEAEAAGAEIRETLPDAGEAAVRAFGEQTLADASGNRVGRETRMLAAATAFDLRGAIALIKKHGGMAVAAHMDRPSFSVFSQLGTVPPDCGFDAVEVALKPANRDMLPRVTALGLPVIASSDAHFPADVGSPRTSLKAREPSFRELSLALRGIGGRRCAYA